MARTARMLSVPWDWRSSESARLFGLKCWILRSVQPTNCPVESLRTHHRISLDDGSYSHGKRRFPQIAE